MSHRARSVVKAIEVVQRCDERFPVVMRAFEAVDMTWSDFRIWLANRVRRPPGNRTERRRLEARARSDARLYKRIMDGKRDSKS